MAAILVVMESAGTRRALIEWLAPQHRVCGLGEGLHPACELDLILADRPALHRFGASIADCARASKTHLPLLLIVPPPHKGRRDAMPAGHGIALPDDLQADGIIATPVTKEELAVRIASLLRLREREKRLVEARELIRLAAELAQLGFWEWDMATDQVHFPLEWSKQLGYDEPLPDRIDEWAVRLHPDDRMRVLASISRLKTQASADFEIEYRLQHRNGTYRWFRSKVALLDGHSGGSSRLVISQLDISEQKATQEHIRRVSQHDMLTGLPNRALLYEFGEHLLAAARRRPGGKLGVLFFDLDRFKPINDMYGHHVGDQVLQQVAKRLAASVRREDVVGRLGGDEFVAVLAQIRKGDDAARVAAQSLKLLGRPYRIDGLELDCMPSIGISLFPQDGETLDLLIQHADEAMYGAKEAGRNRFQFFTEALNCKTMSLALVEKRVRDALKRDGFRLVYQPIIDTVSDAVLGVEALIRLPAPDHDDLGPDVIIPVAETTGLIRELGEWVIHEVCTQHRRWLDAGLPALDVAINISAAQLRANGFARSLAQLMDAACISPHHLSLECTESTLFNNLDDPARILSEIRERGISVTLDDFGAGSSSLGFLGRLPVDKIKIDRSCIGNLQHDRASRAIVEAALAFGRGLKREIVAEGVESEDVLRFMRQRHCHQAQGFYFCRPLPGNEFAHWYRERLETAR